MSYLLEKNSFKFEGYKACNRHLTPNCNVYLVSEISYSKIRKGLNFILRHFRHLIDILLYVKCVIYCCYKGYTTILTLFLYRHLSLLKNEFEFDLLKPLRFKLFCEVLE